MELEQRRAEERARQIKEQRLSDLRFLLQHPQFVRAMSAWLAESGAFGVAELFNAEVYALNAKRAFGLKMWNLLMEADPSKVTEFLNTLTDDKEHME